MLIAIDACAEPDKVFHAYNDCEGVTHEFILNGLRHANELLGHKAFHVADWNVIGEYDKLAGRHQAFVVPSKDTMFEGVVIKAGEKVRIEESHKYSRAQSARLWSEAGLYEYARWQNARGDYGELFFRSFTFLHTHQVQNTVCKARPFSLCLSWDVLFYPSSRPTIVPLLGPVC